MRKPVDHMITLSKNGTLHARRQVKHVAALVVYLLQWVSRFKAVAR